MQVRFTPFLGALAVAATLAAQDAPRGNPSVTIRGQKVAIDYGRPVLKGRTLDSLIAQLDADRVWRAGVNDVTTLTTGAEITIGGKKVPAGKYSVYVYAPKTGDWSLILNTDAGEELGELGKRLGFPVSEKEAKLLWPRLGTYSTVVSKEVVRAPMKSGTNGTPVEQFTINLVSKGPGATLSLAWGDKNWSIDIT